MTIQKSIKEHSISGDPIGEQQVKDIWVSKVAVLWEKKKRKSPKKVKGIRKKIDGTKAKKPWWNQQKIGKENGVIEETPAQKSQRDMKMRDLLSEQAFLMCEWYAQALGIKVRYRKTSKERLMFAAFLALPECQSIQRQDFAKHIWVHKNTLVNWNFDTMVMKARNEIMQRHFMQYTPKLIAAMISGAQRTNLITGLGDPAMLKLAFQYIEKWQEKAELDVTSGGAQIVWWLNPSQFVDQSKIPSPEEQEAEDDEDDEDDDDKSGT